MKQTRMSSKLLSLALLFCMVLTLAVVCPLTVSAEDPDEVVWGASADALTSGGSLNDARMAAYNGTAVYFRLQKDATLDMEWDTWILSSEITLDLGGHTLSTERGLRINGHGLILEDTVGGGAITASSDAAIRVVTESDNPTTVTVKGGTLTGKQGIRVFGYGTVYLVGGTLCGSQYGDVHISGASAKAVVTGSIFTSSVAAIAYGNGGEIDLSGATGDAYTINVVGGMMTPEMNLENVKLPDHFTLFGDDDAKITGTSVSVGKLITAKSDVPAGGGDTGNSDNAANTGDNNSTVNTDNNDNSDFPILAIIIPVAIIVAAAIVVLLIIVKIQKDKETE